MVKSLDDQNLVVFGESPMNNACEDDEDERVFVEADFNTEIIFDATQLCEEQQSVVHGIECQVGQESEVQMEIYTDEVISEKRRHETKPAICDDETSTPVRRRRRTLINRMKGKVIDDFLVCCCR